MTTASLSLLDNLHQLRAERVNRIANEGIQLRVGDKPITGLPEAQDTFLFLSPPDLRRQTITDGTIRYYVTGVEELDGCTRARVARIEATVHVLRPRPGTDPDGEEIIELDPCYSLPTFAAQRTQSTTTTCCPAGLCPDTGLVLDIGGGLYQIVEACTDSANITTTLTLRPYTPDEQYAPR